MQLLEVTAINFGYFSGALLLWLGVGIGQRVSRQNLKDANDELNALERAFRTASVRHKAYGLDELDKPPSTGRF